MLEGLARYQGGDFAGAEHHFTKGLESVDSILKFVAIGDLSILLRGNRVFPRAVVSAFAYASWNAWMLGRADVARERMTQLLAVADENNPYHAAFSGYFSAQLSLYMREYDQAEALAVRALEVSETKEFGQAMDYFFFFEIDQSPGAALFRCALGQARAHQGRAGEGVVLIRQGIARLLETGSSLSLSHVMAALAEALACDGALQEACETIGEALQANPGELYYRPEIFRLRGELQLKKGQAKQAEADFREALALARTMNAKAWELRAALSLARLLRDTGRRDEARTMLADIYNWFTEGFDTADLSDAKVLLDQLAG